MKRSFKTIEDFQSGRIIFDGKIDSLNIEYKTTVSSITLNDKPINHLCKAFEIKIISIQPNGPYEVIIEFKAKINNTELSNKILSIFNGIFTELT